MFKKNEKYDIDVKTFNSFEHFSNIWITRDKLFLTIIMNDGLRISYPISAIDSIRYKKHEDEPFA